MRKVHCLVLGTMYGINPKKTAFGRFSFGAYIEQMLELLSNSMKEENEKSFILDSVTIKH